MRHQNIILLTGLMGLLYLAALFFFGIVLNGDALGYLSDGIALIEHHRNMPNVIMWTTIESGRLSPSPDIDYPNKLFSIGYAALFLAAQKHSAIMLVPGFLAFVVGMYCCIRYSTNFLDYRGTISFILFKFFLFLPPLLIVNRTDLYAWSIMMAIFLIAHEKPRQYCLIGVLLAIASSIRAQCYTLLPFVPFILAEPNTNPEDTYLKKMLRITVPFLVVVAGWNAFLHFYITPDFSRPVTSASFYINEIKTLFVPKLNPLKLYPLIKDGLYNIFMTYYGPFSVIFLLSLLPYFKKYRSPFLWQALLFAIPVFLLPYIQYGNANDVRYLWYGLFFTSLYIWQFVEQYKKTFPCLVFLQIAMAAAEITLFATGPMSSIIGNREKSSRNKQEVKTRFLGDDFSNLSSDVAKHLSENAVILAPGMDYGAANLRGAWLHVFLNTQNIVQTIAYSKFLSGGHNNLIDAIIIMNHEKCDVHYKHFWNYAPGWFENALMRDIIIDDFGNVFVAVSENGKLDPEKTFYKIYVRTLSDKLRHPLMQRPLMGLSASHGE